MAGRGGSCVGGTMLDMGILHASFASLQEAQEGLLGNFHPRTG